MAGLFGGLCLCGSQCGCLLGSLFLGLFFGRQASGQFFGGALFGFALGLLSGNLFGSHALLRFLGSLLQCLLAGQLTRSLFFGLSAGQLSLTLLGFGKGFGLLPGQFFCADLRFPLLHSLYGLGQIVLPGGLGLALRHLDGCLQRRQLLRVLGARLFAVVQKPGKKAAGLLLVALIILPVVRIRFRLLPGDHRHGFFEKLLKVIVHRHFVAKRTGLL